MEMAAPLCGFWHPVICNVRMFGVKMPSIRKQTLKEQMEKWEDTRSKGCTKYVFLSWVMPYGIIMPGFMSLLVFPFILKEGYAIKAIGVFLAIFGPIFILATIFAGKYSWSYFEKRYERWKEEKEGDLINLPGTRRVLRKHIWLLIAIYSIPVFFMNLFYFLSVIVVSAFAEDFVNTYIDIYMFFLSFGFIFVLSVFFLFNGMLFIKNPICGHAMLSNPGDHQHPDAKGSYLKNAWRILKGQPFICLDCADRFVIEKNAGQFEIVKLEKN
jgi:hypothetical protein